MSSKNAQTAPQPKPAAGTKPVRTFRLGRIKASVWLNGTGEKPFHNVTFARTYTGEDQQPHDTASFGRDDLPLVAKVANQAHSFIFEQRAEAKAAQPKS